MEIINVGTSSVLNAVGTTVAQVLAVSIGKPGRARLPVTDVLEEVEEAMEVVALAAAEGVVRAETGVTDILLPEDTRICHLQVNECVAETGKITALFHFAGPLHLFLILGKTDMVEAMTEATMTDLTTIAPHIPEILEVEAAKEEAVVDEATTMMMPMGFNQS